MRSRKSISAGIDVLADTSFLLPALGVDVEEEVLEAIRLFRYVRVHYLEVSLTEAVWKVMKLVPDNMIELVKLGIRSIRETYTLLTPPPQAMTEAMKIYRLGHRDYIDALHYTTAKELSIYFLTIDRVFIDFLKKESYPVKGVILTPQEFIDMVRE